MFIFVLFNIHMHLKDLYIGVAGFCIRLYSDEAHEIYIPDGYVPFLIEPCKKPEATVCVKQGLPYMPKEDSVRFKAYEVDEEGMQTDRMLWCVADSGNTQLVFTSEPYRGIYPYLAADFSDTKGNWTVYNSEIVTENGVSLMNPLAYPMGPLLLYHLALYNNAVMIHASGIKAFDEGYLFSGFSGRGKSTMAGLWNEKGFDVINDDRLLIRKKDWRYYMYNTPMTYSDTPRRAPLSAAFLLRHAKTNKLTKIDGMESMSKMMAFCIQHHYNPDHIKMLLDTIIDISFTTPVYELGFVPDERVLEDILALRKKLIDKD